MIQSHGNNPAKSWQQVYENMAPTMQSHGNNYAQSWQQWQYGRGLCDKLSLVRVSHKNIPTSRISLVCMITFAPSAGCTAFFVIFVFWPSTSIQLSICGVLITMARFPWNISSLNIVDIKSWKWEKKHVSSFAHSRLQCPSVPLCCPLPKLLSGMPTPELMRPLSSVLVLRI